MKYILIIVMLTVNIFAGYTQEETKMIDQVQGIVGRHAVLHSDIESQYIQYKSQGYPVNENSRCEIFESLLFEKLLINQSELDSIEVSETEIEQELERRLQVFINQAGSIKKLEEYFNKSIHEVREDFREITKNQILSQRMQSEISMNVEVTPIEVQRFYKKIPEDSLPLINSEIEIAQVLMYPYISDDRIEEVRKKLSDIRHKVLNGEKKFATQAIMYSEDPGSATKGGSLGFINRTMSLAPEFLAAAFGLKNAGDISRIIKTDFGFHIIQLEEKRGEQIHVRHILMNPEVTYEDVMKVNNILDSIRNLVISDSLTFGDAARRFSEDDISRFNKGVMVNQYTGETKFSPDQLDAATFAVVKSMKVGEISEPYETKDEHGKRVFKIIKLNKRTEPHVANLQDDYQRIKDFTLNDKQQKELEKWMAEKQKTTFIKIMDNYKTCKFKSEGWLKQE